MFVHQNKSPEENKDDVLFGPSVEADGFGSRICNILWQAPKVCQLTLVADLFVFTLRFNSKDIFTVQ